MQEVESRSCCSANCFDEKVWLDVVQIVGDVEVSRIGCEEDKKGDDRVDLPWVVGTPIRESNEFPSMTGNSLNFPTTGI